MEPIGHVRHAHPTVPRHWSLSSVEGELVIQERYRRGLASIQPGNRIVVLFRFHRSPPFTPDRLAQTPPHRNEPLGVFSICSPVRPNPLGMSVLEVLEVRGTTLRVRGVDMFDGTPILDLKPHGTPPGQRLRPGRLRVRLRLLNPPVPPGAPPGQPHQDREENQEMGSSRVRRWNRRRARRRPGGSGGRGGGSPSSSSSGKAA